jgi:hypothetical protein
VLYDLSEIQINCSLNDSDIFGNNQKDSIGSKMQIEVAVESA